MNSSFEKHANSMQTKHTWYFEMQVTLIFLLSKGTVILLSGNPHPRGLQLVVKNTGCEVFSPFRKQ